mmetsp:Transcript_8847/g.22065  ORF Transcript_8847/g.22065 Transcript_8847/m.22065 type:complete len:200 (+) Transcript_8847:279-878(+)
MLKTLSTTISLCWGSTLASPVENLRQLGADRPKVAPVEPLPEPRQHLMKTQIRHFRDRPRHVLLQHPSPHHPHRKIAQIRLDHGIHHHRLRTLEPRHLMMIQHNIPHQLHLLHPQPLPRKILLGARPRRLDVREGLVRPEPDVVVHEGDFDGFAVGSGGGGREKVERVGEGAVDVAAIGGIVLGAEEGGEGGEVVFEVG